MAKILLAEDDLTMRQFLTAALERAGHSVRACENGLEALNAAAASDNGFDLLLADIVMPGIDGIELSKRVSDMNPAIKVVFITGFSGVAVGDQYQDQPHARILSKPFHLNELVGQIETVLTHA